MKRLLIAVILIVCLFVLVSCAKALSPTPAPTPIPHLSLVSPLEVDMVTSKTAYLPGEDVKIDISFKNVGSEPFQIESFPPFIEIIRPGAFKAIRSFPVGTNTKSLGPGKVIIYNLTWDQCDAKGQQVAPGYFCLGHGNISIVESSKKRQHDQGELGRLLILPAEGVMDKTIVVNKPQMINNITITLQRVELSALEARVYAFNVPPDYSLPQGPALSPPKFAGLHAWAVYSFDDGLVRDAGQSVIHFLESGVAHIWNMLDPVPKGTKELTFVITRLSSGGSGPWEFRVPLE